MSLNSNKIVEKDQEISHDQLALEALERRRVALEEVCPNRLLDLTFYIDRQC